jgi:PAS domain S-box-containing protein
MHGSYNYLLVILSYVMAVAASYTALELGRRVSTESNRLIAASWLCGGAFSMGIGIWTMHFIGMLAFSLPMAFSYDVTITILSMLVGVAASGFALYVASRKRQGFAKIGFSGLVLGCGIAAMHYTGMAAMRMDARISYDTGLLVLSVLIAVVAACAAIWIIFTLTNFVGKYLAFLKVGAAMTMGVAIAGMHYTGMAAAIYTPMMGAINMADTPDNTWMALVVGGVAMVMLGITHLTIFFDYRVGIERKHAEKADQKAVRLSEVLDEATNEIYMFDSESLAFVKVNRGAVENLGYSNGELLSMTPTDLKPEFNVGEFRDLLQPLRDGSKQELLFDTVHRRKDGTDYQVQVHLQLSRVTEPPLFLAMITDITDRKALESELMQAKKLESIGQLAAGIAHEINTPAQFVGDNTRFIKDAFKDLMELNGVYTKLLDAAVEGEVPLELIQEVNASSESADVEYLAEEIPSAIDQSLDGITRISNIVRAMKEFSHPGSKEQENADLNQAIQNTITVASNEWKYFADVETDFAENLPPVSCFVQEINQVVLNLIVNAAHAIEQAKAEGDDQKGTITISTRDLGKEVEIKISDTGCGVPEEIRDRIFDPFFTTKAVGKGTGQGLAMAYRTIVEKHEGRLWVDSVDGEGSTFTIVLPYQSKGQTTEEVAA